MHRITSNTFLESLILIMGNIFRRTQTIRIEKIIGIAWIFIGLCGIISPSFNSVSAYVDGRPSAFIISSTLSAVFLLFGSQLFRERISDSEMMIFISPMVLYTMFMVLTYIIRPEAFRYSPTIPAIFVMATWIIMSYTLSSSRGR